jgi:hypothetical protein
VVRMTTALTDVGTALGPEAAIRNVALFVVGHVHRLGRAAATNMAELTIHYRDSPLSVHHGAHHHGAARAGDHAPDPVGLLRPDRTPVAVEELLTGPGLLLLARSEDSDTLEELGRVLGDLGTAIRIVSNASAAAYEPGDCLIDPDDVVGRDYGLGSEGLALIRPDGYLGLVTDSADPGLLRCYLDDVLHIAQRSAV